MTNQSNFVIWQNVQKKNEVSLTSYDGLKNTFPLVAGHSLKDSFPDDFSFSMDPDEPHATILTDSLTNTLLVVVGSERLATFFQQNQVPEIEFLPVSIRNHKGKPIRESYFILHPINPVDCLNLEGRDVQYSEILPDQINRLDRVVLLEDKIPSERVFFRCYRFNRFILVRRNFAEALSAAGFTGFKWKEL